MTKQSKIYRKKIIITTQYLKEIGKKSVLKYLEDFKQKCIEEAIKFSKDGKVFGLREFYVPEEWAPNPIGGNIANGWPILELEDLLGVQNFSYQVVMEYY